MGAFVGDVGINLLDVRAVGQKTASGIEIPTLETGHELVRQGFALPDVDNTKTAEIAVLRIEWSIDDRHFLDQFRTERLQCSQVALAVSLRALVLLDIIHQHFQAAIDAAVIEIKTEPPNLE